jgi:aspartate/methionine/tyrosine aminotransferase
MAAINPQAKELNTIIKAQNPVVYELLSKKGKAIYFPSMGILAQSAAAKGKDINATIGTAYEDDGKPMILSSVAGMFHFETKDAFPYAPSDGIKLLRDKWKDLIKTKNPTHGTREISTPVVTCGVTNGLSIIGYMFVDPSDEIIMSDLYWENYDLVFTNAYDAKLKFFNLFKNGGFDIDSFKKAVMERPVGKKIILLNFPNNPSGYTPTKVEAKEIENILKESAEAGNKLVVILDDSYFGLVFEDKVSTESLFSVLAHIHPNLLAVKADGLTKEEYAWGLRVGFVTYGVQGGSRELYTALEAKTAGAVRGNISSSPHPSQTAFLRALNSDTHKQEKQKNKDKIQERYLKVKEVLKEHPEYEKYFEALPFNSGYFMCVKLKKINAAKVWDQLLKKYSTGVICYEDMNLLRIAFASTPTQQIEDLFSNIFAACKDCA